MNCNNYSLTDHAKSRIISRFNIKNASQLDWAKNVLKQSKRKAKVGNGKFVYTNGSIDMIVDEYNHKIVTVYPYTDDALDKEFSDIKQLNLSTYDKLRDSARSMYRVELRRNANKLRIKYLKISELYQQISHIQSRKLIQAKLIEIYQIKQSIDMINTMLNSYLTFIRKF